MLEEDCSEEPGIFSVCGSGTSWLGYLEDRSSQCKLAGLRAPSEPVKERMSTKAGRGQA